MGQAETPSWRGDECTRRGGEESARGKCWPQPDPWPRTTTGTERVQWRCHQPNHPKKIHSFRFLDGLDLPPRPVPRTLLPPKRWSADSPPGDGFPPAAHTFPPGGQPEAGGGACIQDATGPTHFRLSEAHEKSFCAGERNRTGGSRSRRRVHPEPGSTSTPLSPSQPQPHRTRPPSRLHVLPSHLTRPSSHCTRCSPDLLFL